MNNTERDMKIKEYRKIIRENELRGRTEYARHYRGELGNFKKLYGGE